jgi:glycosyltransferase involved in cell wall biosynthesis
LKRFRIDWLLDSPSPYNDHLFRAVSADPAIDLRVFYHHPRSERHGWGGKLVRGYASRMYRCRAGVDWSLLRSDADLRIFDDWSDPTSQLAMLAGGRFAIWSDTPDLDRRRGFVKAQLRAAFLRRIFHSASSVLATGAPAMRALRQMGCPAEKLVNFPYFIDERSFAIPRWARQGPLTFVSSGRLERVKGYDLAIDALAESSDEFRYVIAGAGPEREALEKQARRRGVRVTFPGWLEPRDLPDFYARGDVFLHPARFEPYGVAVLEAMAAGLAVIASDRTAAALDRIVPGANGLIHKSEDAADLAAQIRRVPKHAAKLGTAARATAAEWPVERGVAILRGLMP